MGIRFKLFIFFLVGVASLLNAGYQWPIAPFDQQHDVSATFCENRPSTDGSVLMDHFHNAIDIPLSEGGPVYAIESGSVESLVREGYSAWIRVGNFNYLHVTPLVTLGVGDNVQKGQFVGYTNYANHVHLIDGRYPDYINPLRSGGIAPFSDPYQPTVAFVKFYQDGSASQFKHGKVYGKVDIVARLYDRTDNGSYGGNNGIYLAGYQIFDSTGAVPVSAAYTPYQFDVRPGNAYVKNVYFPGSDLSTYIYILTNRITGNNYWNTAALTPGKYIVRVYTEDTRNNRREFDQPVEVTLPDHTPPRKPQISALAVDAAGDWRFDWQPDTALDVKGYEFYFSLNGETFSEQSAISAAIQARDTIYTAENYEAAYPLYVRLRAYDNAAITNYSSFSNTYMFQRAQAGNPKFLIVDGFKRSDGYWQAERHDFAIDYAQLLIQNELSFNSCSVEGLRLGKIDLRDYANVIFFWGDDTASTDELIVRELSDYLENGGHLLINGTKYLPALSRQGKAAFLSDWLNDKVVNEMKAAEGLSFENQTLPLQTPYTPAPQTVAIEPIMYGGVFWRYESGRIAAVAYKGTFGKGQNEGAVITCGFPFEMLVQGALREKMFKQTLSFLDALPTGMKDYPPYLPRNKELLQAYPNPFNGQIRFKYDMPIRGEIKIEITDIHGRRVRSLLSGEQRAGTQEIIWDSKNNFNCEVSSGVYIVRINFGQKVQALKIVLIR